MKKAIAALMVVGASLAIPAFSSAGEETAALPTKDVTGSDTYVLVAGDASSASIWHESNGAAGLQTTDLVDAETGEVILPKDTQDL